MLIMQLLSSSSVVSRVIASLSLSVALCESYVVDICNKEQQHQQQHQLLAIVVIIIDIGLD